MVYTPPKCKHPDFERPIICHPRNYLHLYLHSLLLQRQPLLLPLPRLRVHERGALRIGHGYCFGPGGAAVCGERIGGSSGGVRFCTRRSGGVGYELGRVRRAGG